DPKVFRSRDLAQFDADTVDIIMISSGSDFANLYEVERQWRVYSNGNDPKEGDMRAIDKLLDALRGERLLTEKEVLDDPAKLKEAMAKFKTTDPKDKTKEIEKYDAKILIYSTAIEPEKKEEKKDDKKGPTDTKKDPKKDEKKDEKKELPKTPPTLKKD